MCRAEACGCRTGSKYAQAVVKIHNYKKYVKKHGENAGGATKMRNWGRFIYQPVLPMGKGGTRLTGSKEHIALSREAARGYGASEK